MSFDPQACGANCGECPLRELRGGDPVPPETPPRPLVAVIGEAPGQDEETAGVPFVGQSGRLLTKTLSRVGISRTNASWNNVLACRPPQNKLKAVVAKVQAANRKIKKNNKKALTRWEKEVKAAEKAGVDAPPKPIEDPLIKTPQECCLPRIARDFLAGPDNVILAGGEAARAVFGPTSIMSMRGDMREGWYWWDAHDQRIRCLLSERGQKAPRPNDVARYMKVFLSLHPAFVLRRKRYMMAFISDLSKAVRWFANVLEWEEPQMLINPTADQLRAFLAVPEPFYAYDLETDGIEPLTAKIRCVGIGTAKRCVSVALLGKDGQTRFYTATEEERIKAVLREFFLNKSILKAGHNAGSYDRIVCEQQLGYTPTPLIDTILLHRLTASELPHNLGFIASVYTDVHNWKSDREGRKLAIDAETDEELWKYCCFDVAITAHLVPKLFDSVRLRKQDHIVGFDHQVQSVCAEMKTIGMYIDQRQRQRHEIRLVREVVEARNAMREIIANDDFNPSSHVQLRDILFEGWQLDPRMEDPRQKYTDAGEIRTGDAVLRALMVGHLTVSQRKFIALMRSYRKAEKLLGTYILKMRPSDQPPDHDFGYDEEEDPEERWERIRRKERKRGIVDPRTGRMHPGYNAARTTSGRLSSSSPFNAQNCPYDIKDCIAASPGNILIGEDANQLELRIAAARWGMDIYLRVFNGESHPDFPVLMLDPHSITANMAFPGAFLKACEEEGWPYSDGGTFTGKGQTKKLRDLAKRVQYASQYKASVPTVHRVITETEDKEGRLIYSHLTVKDIRKMHQLWLDGANQGKPGIEKSWQNIIDTYRRQGYLTEDGIGRRRDFADDDENENELINFDIQPVGAFLMMRSMLRMREMLAPGQYGPHTGIITQTHDSLTLEVPLSVAEKVAGQLSEAMAMMYRGVRIDGEVDICCVNWAKKVADGKAEGPCPHWWSLT